MAILSLVASDNQALRNQGNALFYALNLIAIPLFFFCMGMLVHMERQRRSLPSLLIGTIKLYGMGLAIYAPKQLAAAGQAGLPASLHAILWATGNSLYNEPLWLVTVLVPGLCLYRLGVINGRPLGPSHLGPLMPLTLVGLTYWLLSHSVVSAHLPRDIWGRPLGLPWSLELTPFVASMLLLGDWYQTHVPAIHRWLSSRKSLSLSLLIICMGLLAAIRMDPALDLNYRLVQAWPYALLATFLGMILIIMASHLLCIHACKARHPFALVGRNGLIILLMFWPIQNALVEALPEALKRSTVAALATSVIVSLTVAGLSQSLVNRYSLLKRIAYV